MKYVLCTVCNQVGHLNCQNIDRKDFHINYEEDSVSENEDENLFKNYTLRDLKEDEVRFLEYQQESDHDDFEFEDLEGISTNMINSKNMKKYKNLHKKKKKHNSKYYNFPREDDYCTESQVNILYCCN